jgi:hypothetical protein
MKMVESPIRSSEGFLIKKAVLKLEQLETRLRNPRTRLPSHDAVIEAADKALGEFAHRWVDYEIFEEKEIVFKQEKRGRPN